MFNHKLLVALAIPALAVTATPLHPQAMPFDVAWSYTPENYPYPGPGAALLSSPGNVALAGFLCSTVPQAAWMFTADGDALGTVPSFGSSTECAYSGTQLVDKSANVFFYSGESSSGDSSRPLISAFTKRGERLWSNAASDLPKLCPDDDNSRYMRTVVVGADSNLYGIEESYADCAILGKSAAGLQ